MSKHKIDCMYTKADQLKNKLSEIEVRVSLNNWCHRGKTQKYQTQIKEPEYSLSEVGNHDMFCTNIEMIRGEDAYCTLVRNLRQFKYTLM